MIKTLERRGLLSRQPGVARSLRVLVPTSELPEIDYGSGRGGGSPKPRADGPADLSAEDAAVTAAIATLERLLPMLPDEDDAVLLVQETASAVRSTLVASGLSEARADRVFARLAAEAARWHPGGHGTIVRRRQWRRR
jgi:hypothetical protein